MTTATMVPICCGDPPIRAPDCRRMPGTDATYRPLEGAVQESFEIDRQGVAALDLDICVTA